MKLLKLLVIISIVGLAFLSTLTVYAGPVADKLNDGLQQIDRVVPQTFRTVPNAVATIFNVVITLSGGIFMIILLIGGIMYLTNAGNEEGVGKAKKMMINAIVGLIITLAAWAIGIFILQRVGLLGSTGGGGNGGSNGDGNNSQPFSIRFIITSQNNQPVPLATVSIDGTNKGQTSTNGLLIVTITNPKPSGLKYVIKVTPPLAGALDPSFPNCNEKTGQYTLDRGTTTEPSKLSIQLDCE